MIYVWHRDYLKGVFFFGNNLKTYVSKFTEKFKDFHENISLKEKFKKNAVFCKEL